MVGTSLIQEIFVGIGSEVSLRARFAAEGFTGTDQLQVVEAAGDAAIAVGVEGVQGDASPAVHTGVDLGAGEHVVEVRSTSPSRRGVLMEVRGGTLLELPLSLDSPSA